MSYAIEVKHLKKNYGHHEVLKGIDLSVKQGEIFGILGINGAGKTTLLECIEGFRFYDSGKIKISGNIGIQLQTAGLPAYIKVSEAIQLFSKSKKTKIDDALVSSLGIVDFQNKLYMQLSAGQKRKLHLLLALIGKPDILFLDEPTTELDVEGKRVLHHEIRRLSQKGVTIILSSHDMAEVESLCTCIAILNHGKIAFLGTTDELSRRVEKKYTIKIISEQNEEEYSSKNISETLLHILEQYKKQNIPIIDIKIDRGTLEQHFLHFSKEE